MSVYGGIETGGSKWECALGTGPEDLRATETVPTTTPGETIDRVVAFFEREGPVDAIGVGSFGPVDRRPRPDLGSHHDDAEAGVGTHEWARRSAGGSRSGRLRHRRQRCRPGRAPMGRGAGLDTFCYITVGTGIGGGGIRWELAPRLVHPELGHLRIPHDRNADRSRAAARTTATAGKGSRPVGRSGARGRPPPALGEDEAVVAARGRYLALGLVCVICILSPQRIVLGGGVMHEPRLLPLIHREVSALMNGYLDHASIGDGIADYVTLPRLGSRSGVLGGIALARTNAG